VAKGWINVCKQAHRNQLREKDDDVRAFAWNRRGVVGSLERGSSEVFYWEFVYFSCWPFISSSQEILNAFTFGLLKSVLVVFSLAEYKLIFYGQ